ncbi:hypothetical protein [Prosthecobacter sp.]|uniref:hypothetical protein n=1 Tax=Prosthecobacter sp. TaxID=1965333 RepID=UPI00378346E8
MRIFIEIAIGAYVCLLAWLLVRGLWMRAQARRAIREDLRRRGIENGRLRKATVWQSGGSGPAGCWSLSLHYDVSYPQEGQKEGSLWYVAHFVPVIGKLCGLELLVENGRTVTEEAGTVGGR